MLIREPKTRIFPRDCMRTIMLKLRIMSYSMAMKIKIFTFNLISGPSLSLPCLESDRDATRWHHDDIRIVRSWKHKSSYHNVHHAHISLTTRFAENAMTMDLMLLRVICHKWWCLSCWRCLNGHVRIVVWTLTLCMTSSHHHYTASYLPPCLHFWWEET